MFVKSDFLIIASIVALSSLVLSSCDTPVGQGAGAGAAAGAIIGGAATGHVRGVAIGAAAGAAVEEDQAARYHPPPGGFPFAQFSGRPGLFYSPYADRLYDPRGGLTRDVDTGELFRKP
jgi:predicted small secreted protein